MAAENERQKLVERLLAQKGVKVSSSRQMSPRTKTTPKEVLVAGKTVLAEAVPVSHAQELMWVNAQLAPDSAFYAAPLEMKLTGRLDILALRRALEHIVARHEVLRTIFRMEGGQLVQWIIPDLAPEWGLSDLSALVESEQQRELVEQSTLTIGRPFDLAEGPILRARLFVLAPERHALLLVFHHIALDGTAAQTFLTEFAATYSALARGEPPPFSAPALQYADYAAWERARMSDAEVEKHLAFWRGRLSDAPRRVDLPMNGTSEVSVDRRELLVEEHLLSELESVAVRHGGTLFMALLAAFELVLGAWSGQADFVVGTVHANRATSEAEAMLGNFVNFLAVRARLSPAMTVAELLTGVQREVMDVYAHHECPFDRVVAALESEKGQGLYNVAILVQNHATGRLPGTGALVAEVAPSARRDATAIDLRLVVVAEGGHATVSFEAARRVFSEEALTRFVDHFDRALRVMVGQPNVRLADVSLLSASEKDRLRAIGAGEETFEIKNSLVDLFSASVREHGDRGALTCDGRTLSYSELDRRAEDVASVLVDRGVGPTGMVGLATERSLEMVIGILGILKAGAAYVALDPAYPEERLEFIARDAGLSLAICTESARDRVPKTISAPLVVSADTPLAPSSANRRSVQVAPADAAYVIYTSGSTGVPKGVVVTHANVARLFSSSRRRYSFGPDDVWSLFHSYAFDFSVWELWGALLHGGRVVVVPRKVATSPEDFRSLLVSERVTVLSQTPLAFQHLAATEASLPDRSLALRYVVFGGEALDFPSLKRWFEKFGDDGPKLINMYGITETTVHVTFREVTLGDVRSARSLIGRALPDLSLHVLDKSFREVPFDVAGELYVGGAGLARGYLGRPELTAERFIPNPFGELPGARLYRTGDVVRALAVGDFEYVGRADHQVKIRGYRIEIGEIEAALLKQPRVAEGIVIVREDQKGDKRLVAYVVARAEPLVVAELRAGLAATLPSYMLPSAFVLLDKLPMTSNGKVDRRALPVPSAAEGAVVTASTRRDPNEELLSAIWADILGVDRVSGEDDFFSLGGHSLSAIRMAQRVREAFGVDLTLRVVFETPELGRLAKVIASARMGESTDTFPALVSNPSDRFEPFKLSEIQQAYLVGRGESFDVGNVSCHAYFELDGRGVDVARLERAWQKVIDRHDMLRMSITKDGRQRVLRDLPPYRIVTEDLREVEDGARQRRLEELRATLSHQVIPVDHWPLFDIRAALLTSEVTRFFFSVDLLIGDALSFLIGGDELFEFYVDESKELPPLAITFRDYLTTEHAFRESALYRKSVTYWTDRLATLPGGPELPLAKQPSALSKPEFRRREFSLDGPRWTALKKKAGKAGVTPTTLILALYAATLAAFGKTAHFSMTLTLFNRLPFHPDVDRLIGDFTSVTILELRHEAQLSIAELAKRLQLQLMSDLDHRYFGGVQVLRELGRKRGAVATAIPINFTSTLGLDVAAAPEGELLALSERFEPVYSITQTPQLWLDHQVSENGTEGPLFSAWDGVEELFPSGFLDAMFSVYTNLVERTADDPDCLSKPVGPLLHTPDRLLQEEANRTMWGHEDVRLETLVRRQITQNKTRPAVIAPSRTLTYGDVDREATRVAHWLLANGATPNRLVGIVMDKGWEQVVAVLGVLYAGAAYLPIDASLPADRIRWLVETAQATALLTQASARDKCPEGFPVLPLAASEDVAVPLDPILRDSSDLAYVIFTSGSTGTPKGVMIDHRGAVNTVLDLTERYSFGPDDRTIALSALNFDLSVFDIFGLLSTGGAIVMPDAEKSRDPLHWTELVEKHQVTLWNTVPALLGAFLDLGRVSEAVLGSLRLVFLSGDWIPLTLPERFRALSKKAELISMGGATEASIWSILFPIGEIAPSWASIPYGKAMRNQTFHVLHPDLTPCPTWVPGDLYIGGVGLARGYFGDEAKTKASFITHPSTGERLYRTGDLGRWLPDANIEFLGREDAQVKVQGYRVELGEIEAALDGHPGVERSVVTVFGGREEAKRLVGFYVPRVDDAISARTELDVDRLADAARAALADRPLHYDEKAEAEVNAVKARAFALFASNAFVALGLFTEVGALHSLDEVCEKGAVLPRYRKWVRRALIRLTELDVLVDHGTRYSAVKPLARQEAKSFFEKLQGGESSDAFSFIRRSAENLDAILTGAKPAVEFLFPSDAEVSEPSTSSNEGIMDRCNRRIAATVAELARTWNGAAPLRLLEIGAGQGTTTRAVLAAIEAFQVEYVFTDVSKFFVDAARDEFAESHPFVVCQTLDIEADPASQGFVPHTYDVVIAGDVLHLARSLRDGFRRVGEFLKTGGLLVMSEVTSFDDAYALSFSLQQGDQFEDEDLRPLHPFLPTKGWLDVMREAGFESSVVIADDAFPEDAEWMYVFLGRYSLLPRLHLAEDSLKTFLRAVLPEYMVPATLAAISSVPLSDNGKVNRKALRDPSVRVVREGLDETPRGVVDEVLLGIWSEVLDADVGIRSDFFTIGGDSLLAMRLVAYVRDALDVEIPLRKFFQAPTVAQMADTLFEIADRDALIARATYVLSLANEDDNETPSTPPP